MMQAMAVYLKASQLMPGCHLPPLYIGMEYSLTNNHPFAEKFLKLARKIAPSDPFVLHELGVTAFNNQVQIFQYYFETDRYSWFKSVLCHTEN